MKQTTEDVVIYTAIGIALASAVLGGLLTYAGLAERPKPAPSDMVCAVFDMSTPVGKRWKGWHPVSMENRVEIRALVTGGKAEWIPAESIDCVERDPRNPKFGEIVERRRMEWWRWVGKS